MCSGITNFSRGTSSMAEHRGIHDAAWRMSSRKFHLADVASPAWRGKRILLEYLSRRYCVGWQRRWPATQLARPIVRLATRSRLRVASWARSPDGLRKVRDCAGDLGTEKIMVATNAIRESPEPAHERLSPSC